MIVSEQTIKPGLMPIVLNHDDSHRQKQHSAARLSPKQPAKTADRRCKQKG